MSMVDLFWYGFDNQPLCEYYTIFSVSTRIAAFICVNILFTLRLLWDLSLYVSKILSMGNEGSLPSDGSITPNSDWQSLYSYGSRPGRRSSLGSVRIPSPMEPPEPDLSHLTPEEIAQIRSVIGRAKEMKDEENKRIRKLEEEYVTYAADVERRAHEAGAATPEIKKEAPLCPICLKSELKIQEGKMKDGQDVCVDCGNLICLNCGSMQASVTSKELEFVCHMCYKRRQLVLSSGLWHPGCDVGDEIPLAREIEDRMEELEKMSAARGPLTRSASLEGDSGHLMPPPPQRFKPLQRQISLPDYQLSASFGPGPGLEIIQETGLSGGDSPDVSQKAESPESDEMKRSTNSTGGNSLKGVLMSMVSSCGMGQPSSRSDSEYSDVTSDVDMEDVSMQRSAVDIVSPDDGSDDYSFMSIGSSDDNTGLPYVKRKHRPKSLNLSRSHSATSSEDETTDSAISTDIESKYNAVMPPDPHELRIALAASAFVQDMRVVDMANDTDDEVAEISAREESGENKIRFSPSAPISPSWREGLESPPFSPRRRDSYPGKRRGSSPVSPKDKRFTYNDISPPSRHLSLEELYDKEAHVGSNNHEASLVPFAQRPSPKSPDEIKDSFYNTSGDMFSFDRPMSTLKKSKPFYSLDTAQNDLSDTSTVMDLATYAATIASSTANLTSMTVSPTNLEDINDMDNHGYPSDSRDSGSSSPASPGIYDNAPYLDEKHDSLDEEEELELADPSQKPIDYQGTKRQKARPPTTDWSPVIDLSPILDVSPSLEEAEQAEMLAQQQEERQRQASREETDELAEANKFAHSSQDEIDYQYYGLKRYERVEDISELVKQTNGTFSPEQLSVGSTDSQETKSNGNSNGNNETFDSVENGLICASLAPVNATPSVSYTVTKPAYSTSYSGAVQSVERRNGKQADVIGRKRDDPQSVDSKKVFKTDENVSKKENYSMAENKKYRKSEEGKGKSETSQSNGNTDLRKPEEPVKKKETTLSCESRKPKITDDSKRDVSYSDGTASSKKPQKECDSPPVSEKGKLRRKLPQPTPEIIATQKQPVPKPRRKEKQTDHVSSIPTRVSKSEIKEPSRAAPRLTQTSSKQGPPPKSQLQKQESDERRRTAKDMKAKPDPLIINHLEIEEASASPQYRVLESPPSPEQKSLIRREYSDSASSVSPSSSPDRDVYLYPSPVTPPDSDSSPPKPHSPSSGTDFDDEIAFIESPKMKPRDSKILETQLGRRDKVFDDHVDRSATEKVRMLEKDSKAPSAAPSKSRHQNSHSKDQKQKEMKKIRRKLPQIPAEEESNQQKSRTRPVPARKPQSKMENKHASKRPPGSSASDDSSMNEDDKEVASIIRKRYINDLDKPTLDKTNGNYLQPDSSSRSSSNGYRSDEFLKANIPPDIEAVTVVLSNESDVANIDKYKDETDEIIDSLINIYGVPITQAMKGLKKRLQEELRRVTEGRRRKIDEIEEIRVLKMQIGELKLGTDKSRSPAKSTLNIPGSNGKKRSPSNSRSSPQVLPRRARHKRQSSDPMVAKFSPIKEDKDIEAEMQGRQSDDSRGCKTADDSSQSGVSDNDSIRSEPVQGSSSRYRKVKPSEYTKMFYNKQAQSTERLDKDKHYSSALISSHSEGNLPLNAEDEDLRLRENKRRELQYEIEKRKKQIAEKTAILKDVRQQAGPNKQLAHSCDELSRRPVIPPYIPPRPIPTGIIKPLDDERENYAENYKVHYQNQTNYSSTEYLAHKQEELMKQRFDDLGAYSSPFLYSGDIGEKSAFVPQKTRTIMDTHSYSTGNVNLGTQDINISASVTLPDIHTARSNYDVNRNQCVTPDMEASPPQEVTPAMPLLSDVTAKSRKIIHEIGTGSRPVSAEFNVGVDELMNGMYRVESDNSVDADEPIMKHMTEGGVTILKQLERRKQAPPAPRKPKKYPFYTKRILLTVDPKDRTIKGRQGNGIGMKIVGGKLAPGCKDVGAYVATIFKGGVADQLHGELQEGDQVLEWNGIELTGKSFEEVQQIIAQPNGEIELVVRPLGISKRVLDDTTVQEPSSHSSYDNLDSEEETDRLMKQHQGVDPRQLAAQLEGIKETESPCISQSSSQHDYQNLSASSACSSPRSDPTSTSSDQRLFAGPEQRMVAKKAPFITSEPDMKPTSQTKKIWDIKQVSTKSERQMGDIQIQLNHDEMDNMLNVHIVQARNLLPKDFNGLSDPFVKVYLLPGRCVENKRRTKHIPRTLNPEWNETVTFPNVHVEELKNKTLEITVWDYDRFKTNDFLGEVVLDLAENAFLDNYPHWYPLSDHDESTGVDLPRPTVLPPKSGDPETESDRSSSKSPRPHSKDRADKNVQSGGSADDRMRRGMGRRRRSLGTLIDTDRLQTKQPTKSSSARTSPIPQN